MGLHTPNQTTASFQVHPIATIITRKLRGNWVNGTGLCLPMRLTPLRGDRQASPVATLHSPFPNTTSLGSVLSFPPSSALVAVLSSSSSSSSWSSWSSSLPHSVEIRLRELAVMRGRTRRRQPSQVRNPARINRSRRAEVKVHRLSRDTSCDMRHDDACIRKKPSRGKQPEGGEMSDVQTDADPRRPIRT